MMSRAFLVDTNVLSELMRTQPDLQVVHWFDMHIDAECYTSSITKAEIFLGIALLTEGIRRTRLTAIAEKSFSDDFVEPCLPFDDQSALIYANVVSNRRRT
jgi:toxin FitB